MKRLLVLLFPGICLAVVLICWGSLHGSGLAGSALDEAGYDGEKIGMPGLALRVALALGLILLLIVAAVYTLRAVSGRAGPQPRGHVKVLDRCYLAPKRALYTVRMGGRAVVIGVTEASMTPVLELSPEETRELYPEIPDSPAQTDSFSSLLKNVAAKAARVRG